MPASMDALVDAAMGAQRPRHGDDPLPRHHVLRMVQAVLRALDAPAAGRLAIGDLTGAPGVPGAMDGPAPVGAPMPGIARRPVVQGTGFEYLGEGVVMGRILQCMGERSWSVTVEGKRWRLPEGSPANLIHPGGKAGCTYRSTLAEAEATLAAALADRRRTLPWPDAARAVTAA